MIFPTRICGIPCQCWVTRYRPAKPLVLVEFGETYEPEAATFEYVLLNSRGHRAPWLHDKVTDADECRLLDEYLAYTQHEERKFQHR